MMGVSVHGERGLCPGGEGSLSMGRGVSVHEERGLCPGRFCPGSLCPRGVSVRGDKMELHFGVKRNSVLGIFSKNQ